MSDETPKAPKAKLAAIFGVGLMATLAAVGLFVGAMFWLVSIRAPGWAYGVAAGAYGLAVVVISLQASKAGMKAMQVRMTPAQKVYQRRFMAGMLSYVIALSLALVLRRELDPTGLTAIAIAILPAIPLVWCVMTLGLYLREETDEYHRAVFSESALWATGGLLVVATVWGFLEQFDVVAHVPAWAAFPTWAVCLAIGQVFARRRYQ